MGWDKPPLPLPWPWPSPYEYAMAHPCPSCYAPPGVECAARNKISMDKRVRALAQRVGMSIKTDRADLLHKARLAVGERHRARDIRYAPPIRDRITGERYDTLHGKL